MAGAGANCSPFANRPGVLAALAPIVASVIAVLSVGCGSGGAGSSSAPRTVPRELRAPSIVGIEQAGQRLTAAAGSWSPAPASYSFAWERCERAGKRCTRIRGAIASTYRVGPRDVGARLRIAVIAFDRVGGSSPALSAPTPVLTREHGLLRLEYVFNDGPVSVYDIDHGFKLVESFTLPGTDQGVRGVAVSPVTHMMFVSYGGDGGGNGSGSVLAYDLVHRRVAWSVHLHVGIDSGAVSTDGKLLYMPDGEQSSNGNWFILDTATGGVIVKIDTPGSGPHDGVMSTDGTLLQLGDRNYSRLLVYNTKARRLQANIGPLVGGVRPNTINGPDSIAFTTATGFDGFQVESITRGSVLYTKSFASCEGPFSTCSHGISLSPDNTQVYVIDTVHKAVQVWDVHGVAEGIAPTHVATVPVDGLQGTEKGCAYDCGRDGWLQHTLDGRYVLAGDTGDVIETATHRVVARIQNLLNTRKFVEIDWAGGRPTASSGRQGVGALR
jgi:DNA-binding beta-propeller fold protein YncE